MNKKRILIITAHADDDITCAGSVFKLQDRGYEAYEILLTNSGEGNSTKKDKLKLKDEVIRLRNSEFDKASKFLGIKQKFLFGEEDLNLKFSKEIMLRVVKIIREVKPEIIFTMNEVDYHSDHIAAAKITREASFWAATGVHPELGKAHRTPQVLYGEGMLPINPVVLVNITGYEKKKLKLFRIYDSQANSKSLKFEEALMRVRGYHVRQGREEFAEAFSLNDKFPTLLYD